MPDDAPRKRPLFYAHRGASFELPENTVESFARAVALGADVLETDVHVTRDGHVVLSHDPTGLRAAGVPDAVASVTLEELKRWDAGRTFADRTGARAYARRGLTIPTLDEILRAFPQMPFNVDIKLRDPAAANAVVATVRAAGACERVLLTSFHFPAVQRVRALRYEGVTGLTTREVLTLLGLPLPLARGVLRSLGARHGVRAQIPYELGPVPFGTRVVLDRFHALGVPVDYWTVNDPAVARRLLAAGADGIMTDDPASIAPVFARG